MMTCSLVKHEGKYSIISNTSTPNHHAHRISNMSVSLLNLHTKAILPPVGK